MWLESDEQPKPLRTGLTTGCCATACSLAAAQVLLLGKETDTVSVTLPRGKIVELEISEYRKCTKGIIAVTIKDAGDDPDVTHGARVFVQLSLSENKGVRINATDGVGIVTRTGLPIAVGEAAINPVPRKMIAEHLEQLADEHAYHGGFDVSVGVEQGNKLALKTMNPRLGIVGGLSILGTTGIVRPFSCSAYIASIHLAIDVAKANGIEHIAASTGSSSEAFIKQQYQLSDIALVETGDFVGAVMKYLKRHPIKRVSLCGGFGKISKLAQGHLDLHSKTSQIDFNFLADCSKEAGADEQILKKIRRANTSLEALEYCQNAEIDLANMICQKALEKALDIVPASVQLEVWAIDRTGKLVGSVT